MIVLLCPECSSENMCYGSSKDEEDFFTCEDCGAIYPLSNAGWRKITIKEVVAIHDMYHWHD